MKVVSLRPFYLKSCGALVCKLSSPRTFVFLSKEVDKTRKEENAVWPLATNNIGIHMLLGLVGPVLGALQLSEKALPIPGMAKVLLGSF